MEPLPLTPMGFPIIKDYVAGISNDIKFRLGPHCKDEKHFDERICRQGRSDSTMLDNMKYPLRENDVDCKFDSLNRYENIFCKKYLLLCPFTVRLHSK